MTTLENKSCVPCSGDVPPLSATELGSLMAGLDGWQLIRDHHLTKDFRFDDFVTALAFTNRIGALAEEQGHHPDIYLTWGQVSLTLWTHKIDGLTESDFIFAARADLLA